MTRHNHDRLSITIMLLHRQHLKKSGYDLKEAILLAMNNSHPGRNNYKKEKPSTLILSTNF